MYHPKGSKKPLQTLQSSRTFPNALWRLYRHTYTHIWSYTTLLDPSDQPMYHWKSQLSLWPTSLLLALEHVWRLTNDDIFFKKGKKGVETTSLYELSRLAKVCGLKSKNSGSYGPKCSPKVQGWGGHIYMEEFKRNLNAEHWWENRDRKIER